jgi:DNA polymerase delta subunit 2
VWIASIIQLRPTPTVVAVVDNNNNKPKQQEHDAHLLLISGLDCGSAEMSSLPNDMLISFLQGSLGAVHQAAKVSHVICAGGLIATQSSLDNYLTCLVHGCRKLDGFCWQVTDTAIPITVIPGCDDPTTANWPQQPLHLCIAMERCCNVPS